MTSNQLSVGHQDADGTSVANSILSREFDVRKEIKHGKPLRATWGLLADFSSNSTVHGLRYVFEQRRHWTERLWWAVAVLLAVCGCARIIRTVYVKWEHSPVLVSFAEKSMPLWEIPFPAVTICPETKVQTPMLNFTSMFHQLSAGRANETTEVEFNRMMAALHVCESYLMEYLKTDGSEDFTRSINIQKTLRQMAPTFDQSFTECMFRHKVTPCHMFKEVMTEEGVCFSFNMLNSRELYRDNISEDFLDDSVNPTADRWTMEGGYTPDPSPNVNTSSYPYRIFSAGEREGVLAVLTVMGQHLDYLCRGPVPGFKVLLHSPDEVPRMSRHFIQIPLRMSVMVAIKPTVLTTSEGLRNYTPNRRQCFFNAERQLQFMRVYTQSNCELECVANYTLRQCGCVKFSMPRAPNTTVCSVSKIECCREAEIELQKQEYLDSLSGRSAELGCNCLPACTSIVYDVEISQARIGWTEMLAAYTNLVEEYPGFGSFLKIFFKNKQFISTRRSELYGPADFLASCGGLVGLFMGVSMLSIVEIIYFCTLRLFCNLRLRQHRQHVGMVQREQTDHVERSQQLCNIKLRPQQPPKSHNKSSH